MGDVREVKLEDRGGGAVIVLGLHGLKGVGSVGTPPMDDAVAGARRGGREGLGRHLLRRPTDL